MEKCLGMYKEELKEMIYKLVHNGYRKAYYDTCHELQQVYRNDVSLQTPTLCDKFQDVFETLKTKAACDRRDEAVDSAMSSVSILFEKLQTDLMSEIISYNKNASIEIKDLLTKKLTKEIEQKYQYRKDESTSIVFTESTSSLFLKKDNKINWSILRK
jgi:hypothetical protein